MLYDFICKNTECACIFEELVSSTEDNPHCPKCNSETDRSFNTPSSHSPKYWEMHRKMELIKGKIAGRIPWRKYSESQSD